jgi:hypothetical protein
MSLISKAFTPDGIFGMGKPVNHSESGFFHFLGPRFPRFRAGE